MPQRALRLLFLFALIDSLAWGNVAVAWQVDQIPLHDSATSGFHAMALDESGMPWVLAGGLVQYFDGKQFVALDKNKVSSGSYTTQLVGGPDRGLYLTQPGEEEHLGYVFRLNAGQCEEVTSFYYDAGHYAPGFYVSQDGRLFNWGETFLAVYDGEDWKRIEAQFNPGSRHRPPAICDLGDDVYFYSTVDNRVYHCNKNSVLDSKEGPSELRDFLAAQKQRTMYPVPPRTSPWHGDRVLIQIHNSSERFAFNVRTNEIVNVNLVPKPGQSFSIVTMKPLRDGSVLFVSRLARTREHTLFKLSPDGTLDELPGSRGLAWESGRDLGLPHTILETRDGSLVFGLREFGISVYRDGKLTHYGREQGLFTGVTYIGEGANGDIWFPLSNDGKFIGRLKLGAEPVVQTEVAKDWSEFNLVSRSRVWRLNDQTIALFETDHPNQLTRRTGDQVRYQPLTFDPKEVRASVVDDRGHLLLETDHGKAYDVAENDVTEYNSFDDLLVAAVSAGAKRFQFSPQLSGVIVTPDKRIWYGKRNDSRVRMWDGAHWKEFGFRDSIYYIFATEEGPLIRSQGGKFYRHVEGQMQQQPFSLTSHPKLMLGPQELQPLDETLLAEHPGRYFPFRRIFDETRLYYNLTGFEQSFESDQAAKDPEYSFALPRFHHQVVESRFTGAWLLMSQGAGAPFRIVGNEVEKIDFSGTPLAALSVMDVVEESNGNVWFLTYYGGSPRAFRLSASQLSLESTPVDTRYGRTLELAADIKPQRLASSVELVATLNGQPVPTTRTANGKLHFRFPEPGKYDVSIGGVWLGSVVPNLQTVTVNAEFDLPETTWIAPEKEVTVRTPQWRPPVTVKPAVENQLPTLEWRVVGKPWQQIPLHGTIALKDLPPGTYDVQLRAVEEDTWRDPTPVQVKLNYEPDFGEIVHKLALKLGSSHADERRQATEQLEALGPPALPELRREIQATEGDLRVQPTLRNILEKIEQTQQK